MIKFFFPLSTSDKSTSIALLVLRIIFGGMLILHGWGKMTNFSTIAPDFMGGSVGLALAVFAEVFCAFAIVIGLLHRLALIPLIINMFVAFFIAHNAILTGEGNGEMALLYLAVYVALFVAGAGKYSIDRFIAQKIEKQQGRS